MQVTLLKSKLHRATVTAVSPDYSGSLSIDRTLMKEAGFLHHEKILVGNISNGERFETYCIPAPEGSGEIALNGAAAHKGSVGDLLVILTFINLEPEEASVWEPRVVIVGKDNKSHELAPKGK
ncbi:MAG: aspartate 1-decarboxylase [Opitutae bacterium]|nr:aspartate 1-decarboxylase [Opitutae bacterium]MEC9124104.1 aspartate 1-decarboxylase [Verrucomicrobiota bacterium]HAE10861.1 aspartate 1-decarboxylase [Opitutae bacterium]|tara:strand:+ start:552 stop:920 length:369 start_codon:yes stop_codon:yes gene_type:complete